MDSITTAEPMGWSATLALLSVVRPTPAQVQQVVHQQSTAPFTYADVGATRGEVPSGWALDDRQRSIGSGKPTFERAVTAMRTWSQFDLPWVFPLHRDVPLEEGHLFAFVAHTYGVWSVNVCRIVYTLDEQDERGARFGFAYGTVGAHSVRGEERFHLEWDRKTDEVTFRIRKFSKPATPLLAVLAPLTQRVQSQFTVQALERLEQAVQLG